MGMQPSVMVLGYHHLHSLQVIAELSEDLDAEIMGVATETDQPILQSRYCDVPIVLQATGPSSRRAELRREIERQKPDIVLPIGYESVLDLDTIQDSVDGVTEFRLPPTESLRTALDKSKTATVARSVDVNVPKEYRRFQQAELPQVLGQTNTFSFPVFLKANRESGRNILSKVESAAEFESIAKELFADDHLEGEELLIQEYVPGDGHTYGCGFLFENGEPIAQFGQKELRSIPREGGTGTRVSIYRDEQLEEQSVQLLRELDWDGFALVEYRKRPDGTFVLMEINPKIWASYALASRHGYRFGTEIVSAVLDIERPAVRERKHDGQMIFPLRELYYTLKHSEDESLVDSAKAMMYPPAPLNVHLRDLRAWLFPAGPSTSVKWIINLWRNGTDPYE